MTTGPTSWSLSKTGRSEEGGKEVERQMKEKKLFRKQWMSLLQHALTPTIPSLHANQKNPPGPTQMDVCASIVLGQTGGKKVSREYPTCKANAMYAGV